MRETLATSCLIFFCFSVATADSKFNNENDPIAYFSPTDVRYPSFRESFFSDPTPIVVIDPVVFGKSEDHPNRTTIQQVSRDEFKIRISGTVFDFLADMVADHQADIKEVRIYSHTHGLIGEFPLAPIDGTLEHPFRKTFEESPGFVEAIRPYSFGGRFDSGELTLAIQTGYNGISVSAENLNEGSGSASVEIAATVNREKGKYDLTADVLNNLDAGLYKPILVYINDPAVNQDNVGEKYATINGARVGLRFIDDQLQLDRPIMGINHTPPKNIPNLVNVTGDPDHFMI